MGDGKYGYADEGTICAVKKMGGGEGGCGKPCGPKCTLTPKSGGQFQWQCQNPDCRAFVNVPRASAKWRAAAVRFNADATNASKLIAL
jgi:hypothetical protein